MKLPANLLIACPFRRTPKVEFSESAKVQLCCRKVTSRRRGPASRRRCLHRPALTTGPCFSRIPPLSLRCNGCLRPARTHSREATMPRRWNTLDKADKLVPNQAAIQIGKALILSRRGKIAEAAAAHDRAVEILPKSVPMRVMRAGFRMDQKQYAKAREDLAVAMQILPGDEGLRFNIILTYLLEKNQTAAQSQLEEFKQPSDTAAFYFGSSALAYSSSQVEKSIEWIASGYRIFGVQRCAPFYAALRRAGLLKVLGQPYYPEMTLGGIKK